MFTGLIQSTGTILAIGAGNPLPRITVSAPGISLRTGDSVAINGVCLTALDIRPGQFSADLSKETVEKTSLLQLKAGSIVNLELPTPSGAPLGGHIVQGHVDGKGTLLSLLPVASGPAALQGDWGLSVALPPGLGRYIVEKGSVAIDGISLTVARWDPDAAENGVVHVAIIPHTYSQTNLRTLKPGDPVNIEADMLLTSLGSRTDRQSGENEFQLTAEYLIRLGY